eukprot:CAMPEP_0172619622 /NCGR_PEP_ID=MMETSP1068-20121228/95112_1 /TAXON_ID=35684 /ORGANISM="Pseudopedinella elastica, Strain CCMP716" /LENGTH=34 /DNA_ID= /DNA_START= /DNA_END= /DNA_ORIENTATION=
MTRAGSGFSRRLSSSPILQESFVTPGDLKLHDAT